MQQMRNIMLPRDRVGQAPEQPNLQLIITNLRQQIDTLQGEGSVELKKQLNTSLDNIILQKQRIDKLNMDLAQNRENIRQSQLKIDSYEKQRNAAVSLQNELKKSMPSILQQLQV